MDVPKIAEGVETPGRCSATLGDGSPATSSAPFAVGTHVWFQLLGKRTKGLIVKVDDKSALVRYKQSYYDAEAWRPVAELEAMT